LASIGDCRSSGEGSRLHRCFVLAEINKIVLNWLWGLNGRGYSDGDLSGRGLVVLWWNRVLFDKLLARENRRNGENLVGDFFWCLAVTVITVSFQLQKLHKTTRSNLHLSIQDPVQILFTLL
jgi:hypothetical protein